MRHSRAFFLILLAGCPPKPPASPPAPAPASASACAPATASAPASPPAPSLSPRPSSPPPSDPAPPSPPAPPAASVVPLGLGPSSARACRHARADEMAKACSRDEQCASPAIAKACPGVPLTFACERGRCRSRRTDGCDPPYELDADAMRKVIVDCVVP